MWTIQHAGDRRERPKTECCGEFSSSYVGRPDVCMFMWYVERVPRVKAKSKS
jgi:hypothetical protein